jgi:hypothetical protein
MLKSLSEFTEEDLQEIFNLAALFFTPREIASIRGFETNPFIEACDTEGTKFYEHFDGGRKQGEIDIRKGIIKMAAAGSTPAQTMAMDLLKQSKLKMMDR